MQSGVNRNKYTFCTMKSPEPLKNLKSSPIPYLKVPKCEIFDLFDSWKFYTIKFL